MAKPILYYTNEQSLRLFKKQREKELDNELKQLEKNERFRLGEIYTEEEADTLAQLYKKTMEKVGIFKKEPASLSLEANIKRLIKEKEKEKLPLGTLPVLTTPEPNIIFPPAEPVIPPKPSVPKITPEMINSVLSKFNTESKLDNALIKNINELSTIPIPDKFINELKQKLQNINALKKVIKEEPKKESISKFKAELLYKINQMSEQALMAENDKDINNLSTEAKLINDKADKLLDKIQSDAQSIISSEATTADTSSSISTDLKNELINLMNISKNKKLLEGPFLTLTKQRKLTDMDKFTEAWLSTLYTAKTKSWREMSPTFKEKLLKRTKLSDDQINNIINKYIQLGGQGIMKKRKFNTTKKTYRK